MGRRPVGHNGELPPVHPDIATSLSGLALLLEARKNYAEAEPLLRQALQIFRTDDPPEHPQLATILNNVGDVLRHLKRLHEAEPFFREALAIDRKSLSPKHPDYGMVLNNLALLQFSPTSTATASLI